MQRSHSNRKDWNRKAPVLFFMANVAVKLFFRILGFISNLRSSSFSFRCRRQRFLGSSLDRQALTFFINIGTVVIDGLQSRLQAGA